LLQASPGKSLPEVQIWKYIIQASSGNHHWETDSDGGAPLLVPHWEITATSISAAIHPHVACR
jgi:hypothetical protein